MLAVGNKQKSCILKNIQKKTVIVLPVCNCCNRLPVTTLTSVKTVSNELVSCRQVGHSLEKPVVHFNRAAAKAGKAKTQGGTNYHSAIT